MDLADAVVYALVEAMTSVLPLSSSGHQLVARIWLGDAQELGSLKIVAELGWALALAVSLRQRLLRALSEGIRGIARPGVLSATAAGRDATALVLAALTATAGELALSQLTSPLHAVPAVTGAGLMLSAAALTSTRFAPSPQHTCPSAGGAVIAGLAHGFAVIPGASQVGAAFVALRWLGVSSANAAEMALLIALPVTAFGAVLSWLGGSGLAPLDAGMAALGAMVAFVGASIAASWWRRLADKNRTAWLSLWLVPLSLAVLAYGRALPQPLTLLR